MNSFAPRSSFTPVTKSRTSPPNCGAKKTIERNPRGDLIPLPPRLGDSMSGHRDLLHRMERFARRKVRDPMRGFLRGTPQTGQSPGRSPTLPRSAPVREPAGAETTELMHRIIGQQTMLTH